MGQPRQPKSNATPAPPGAEAQGSQPAPSVPVEAQLKAGIRYLQSGQFAAAETCFQQLLGLAPDYPDAWHFWGVVAAQQQQYAVAEERMRRSISLHPQSAIFHSNLGNVFREQGKLAEAIAACHQSLQIAPNFADAHNNLGTILQTQGKLVEAIAAYQTATRLKPNHTQAHHNLENALKKQGELNSHQSARQLKPEFVETQNQVKASTAVDPAQVQQQLNLGIKYCQSGNFSAAEVCFRQLLAWEPNNALFHSNFGSALQRQGKLAAAISSYQQAIQLNPNHANFHYNLGTALKQQEKLPEAIDCYQVALQIDATQARTHSNLGNTLREIGQLEKSIFHCQQATQLDPSHANAHANLSFGLLTMGQYRQGWDEYEWRFKKDNPVKKAMATPMWKGPLPSSHHVLLWSEQGLGDSLQFIRYARLLRQQGISTTIATQKPLVRLFQECLSSAADLVIDQDRADLSCYEVHTSLMSLPQICQTTLETIPADIPYIQVSGILPAKLQLPAGKSLKVGIVWASAPSKIELYRQKSIPLELFLQPFKNLDCSSKISLLSLQVGRDATPLESWSPLVEIHDFSPFLKDFVDTAWVISQLDLVITVDTAVAHLAGAMGKPVWVLLPFVPDWRWLLDRQDSPWYPTMRLFRQPSRGDWETVVAQVQAQLQQVLQGESLVFPLPAPVPTHPPKTEAQTIPQPKILVMSLPRRRDRYEKFQRWNDQQAIGYEWVEAIDGQQLHFPDLVQENLASPQLQHYTPGALGCALSHRKLWQRCVAENQAIVVCEDDAVLRKDFAIVVPDILQKLPPDWDIVLLGYNFDSATSLEISPGMVMHSTFPKLAPSNLDISAFQLTTTHPTWLPLQNAFGCCAYALSPQGAKEILARCFPLTNRSYHIPCLRRNITSFGIDSVLNEFYQDIQTFCVIPPLAITPNDKKDSDISN